MPRRRDVLDAVAYRVRTVRVQFKASHIDRPSLRVPDASLFRGERPPEASGMPARNLMIAFLMICLRGDCENHCHATCWGAVAGSRPSVASIPGAPTGHQSGGRLEDR